MHHREGQTVTEKLLRRSRMLSMVAAGLAVAILAFEAARALAGGPMDQTSSVMAALVLVIAGSDVVRLDARRPGRAWAATLATVGLTLLLAVLLARRGR
jgi:hypothetical protein